MFLLTRKVKTECLQYQPLDTRNEVWKRLQISLVSKHKAKEYNM